MIRNALNTSWLSLVFCLCGLCTGTGILQAQDTPPAAPVSVEAPAVSQQPIPARESLDEKIDGVFTKSTGWFVDGIFSEFNVPVGGKEYGVKWVVIWLAAAGVIFTLAFKFINIRAFGLALRTVRGKYSDESDPGEITHFQALATAVSGTVGLGNIAGVAIGISMAGPGVAFWLFLSGFLGMATKFAECTLGMKYREIDSKGRISGGGMQYLRKGFAERGLKPVGVVLAILFAIFCVFASFGGGNVFQINQATAQLLNVTGGAGSFFASRQWLFGGIVAVVTGMVIIGGIHGIARVTSKLVPLMCVVYVVSAAIVLVVNAGAIPTAISEIVSEAFKPRAAVVGGVLAAFIWGMRRATFSNEAGIGSAPIAHSAAKSRMPASEGIVALLEPFIDTVVVCTMTSLVLVTTMNFDSDGGSYSIHGQSYALGIVTGDDSNAFGIGLTSAAFQTVHGGFEIVLFACVLLFAFSTMITWSYYGLQAWEYLFGKNKYVGLAYKLIFCLIIVAGSSAKMSGAVDFSDASLFAMSIPNLIGVYFLMPVVARELRKFQSFSRHVDAGDTLDEAEAKVAAEG